MKRFVTWFSAFSLFAIFAVAGAPSGFAGATVPTQIYDYETMFGRLDADGSLRSLRLVNQLRVFGEGDVVITDLAPTQDFRNLTGNGSPSVGDGTVEWSIRGLSGSQELFSAATPDQEPPLSMMVTYYRNGEQLPGPDAVGKSGTFDVTFDIANQTAQSMQTTITNAAGKTETVTQMVPLPMVAELQLVLPQGRFTRVDAPGADIVTDPNGNLVVRWAMVLVPPIGDLNQTFNLRVDSDDFQVDAVRLQGVPVAPKDRPFLAFAQDELSSGIEKATSLHGGAESLSGSMSDLHDGALKLVDGTEQLMEGSKELAEGLGAAFDGSSQITSGGGQITSGLGQLGGGLRLIRGGLEQAAAAVPEARDGAQEIAGGAALLEAGVHAIRACLVPGGDCDGNPSIPTIAAQLKAGVEACLGAGPCPTGLDPPFPPLVPPIPAIAGGIIAGAEGIADAADLIAALAGVIGGQMDDVITSAGCDSDCGDDLQAIIDACLTSLGGPCGAIPANVPDVASGIKGGATTGDPNIKAGAEGIQTIAAGLKTNADNALDGINAIAAGLVTGIGSADTPETLLFGLNAIKRGGRQLARGIGDLLAGLGSRGNPDTLIGGATAAIDGTDQLTAGASRLTSGSGELTAGLARAADGSNRLADGNEQAHDGAGQIEQGIYLINELGLSEVQKGANETVASLDRQLQLLEAQNERAAAFSFYGPPSSDQAETVAGGAGVVLTMDALSNRGADTTTRAIGILIVLAILAGLWLIARAMRGSPAEV